MLSKAISERNVKTVLEFGSGLSTLLMDNLRLSIDSYDSEKSYIDKVKALCSESVRFHLWNNRDLEVTNKYDLAFVDGGLPRVKQGEIAFSCSDLVAVDDINACSRSVKIPKDFERIDGGDRGLVIFRRKS